MSHLHHHQGRVGITTLGGVRHHHSVWQSASPPCVEFGLTILYVSRYHRYVWQFALPPCMALGIITLSEGRQHHFVEELLQPMVRNWHHDPMLDSITTLYGSRSHHSVYKVGITIHHHVGLMTKKNIKYYCENDLKTF